MSPEGEVAHRRLSELLGREKLVGLTAEERQEMMRVAKTCALHPKPSTPYVPEYDFYKSYEWRQLRYRALKSADGRCMCCGSSGRIHVDHIKPRSKFPELELDINNLQVLCEDCNLGKGAWDKTDWRNRNQ